MSIAEDVRVLMVDSDDNDAQFVQCALRMSSERVDVQHVYRLADALTELTSRKFDVVLTELALTDSTGRATVERLRERDPHVPIVIHTTLKNDEDALDLLDDLAQDYLIKGYVTADVLQKTLCEKTMEPLEPPQVERCDPAQVISTVATNNRTLDRMSRTLWKCNQNS